MSTENNQSELPEKRKGRPPLQITQDIIDQAEVLGSQGMNMQQIADALGMGLSTIYEKIPLYPEFAEAIKRGKAKGIALVTEKLQEKILSMDTASIIFYLKAQAKWRDHDTVDVSANGAQKIEINITGGPPANE